jgi:hypothetical protein
MDESEKEIRSRRAAWHLAPPGGMFTRDDLSPKQAYDRPRAMPQTEGPGPGQRAVIDHMFDPETMFLRLHGVGEPGDGCTARIWGIEKTAEGLVGRFLCDIDVRLSMTAAQPDSKAFPLGTHFANHVEFIEDMAPMPGVLRQPESGRRGVFPTVILGGWGYAVYVLEMARLAAPGVRPMKACGAMWRAYTVGPPLKITPEMLRDPEDDDMADEWKGA